jgi:hypothetical protein
MKFKSNSPFTKSVTPTAALFFLIAAFILSGCAQPPAEVTIAVQEDGIELIASPTPTFELPGPDDEDPIVDCVLDAPICLVNTAIEHIGEAPFLTVDIAIDPSNESFKGTDEELVLEGKVSIVQEGTHAGDVEVQDHTIAEASPDVGLILTNPEGEPLVNLITTVDGYLFYCNHNLVPRCPQQTPIFSFDPATGDIIILNNEGIPVGEVEYSFPPGVVFGNGSDDAWPNWIWVFGNNTDDEWPNWGDDTWPNWGWAFSFADIEDSGVVLSDPAGNPVATLGSSDGALFVFEPNGSPVAILEHKPDPAVSSIRFTDSSGEPMVALSLQEGKVVMAEEGGGPLMTLVIGEEGAGKVEEGESVLMRILVPLPEELSGRVEIAGTIEVSTINASGVQQKLNSTLVTIEVEDIQAEKAVQKVDRATPVPTQTAPKQTPVPTEAPPKAAPTKAPTRPTATPDNSKVEPTPTPSK